MVRLKEGDRVRIVDRIPNAVDAKSGLFYNYYRGLSGTIFKLYGSGDAAQAAIDVDIESLPEDVARRHLDIRDQIRDGLPGEVKRALAQKEAEPFPLRYVILVAVSDLTRSLTSAARRLPAPNGKGKAA